MLLYSFIIPHKNSPQLLKRCLDSIPLRNDIQIIVVDDNSDDNKKPIIDRKDVHVVYLSSKQSMWAGRARNRGIEEACGKWLLFADCDDYYVDGFIDELDKYAASDKDVIYFNYYTYSRGGKKKSSLYENEINQDAIKYRINAPWNKMIRREFVNKYNIRFEECINGNDMFFSYQVGTLAQKVYIEESPLYCYQITAGSMTNKRRNSDEYYLCRLNHWYQTGEFLVYVGHPEWKSSLIWRFMAILSKKGFCQFCRCIFVYFNNISDINNSRFKFVDIVKDKLKHEDDNNN